MGGIMGAVKWRITRIKMGVSDALIVTLATCLYPLVIAYCWITEALEDDHD